MSTDITLRDLQKNLSWVQAYSAAYEADSREHKIFAHAVLHLVGYVGKLASLAQEWDHTGASMTPDERAEIAKTLADLVILTARVAEQCPGASSGAAPIDLQDAVNARVERKFPPMKENA